MHERITTTSNFAFIQENFIEAKKSLNEEKRTGKVIPGRLRGIGLEGASRTGKSFDISVFICHYVSTYEGKQILICRDHLSNLKSTFYKTLKKVWVEYFGYPSHHFNKSATDISFNGNTISFIGTNEDLMKSHGTESDVLVVNEAMGVSQEPLNQLLQRNTEFYMLDYNPSAVDSALYDREKLPSYRLHKTTIFDNPYAPANAKATILGYAHPDVDDYHIASKAGYSAKEWEDLKDRNLMFGTAHKYRWEVYGLGKRAVGEDIIFDNWDTYSEEPDDSTLDWDHLGGDFGFKVNPSAGIRTKRQGNHLYLKQEIYESGLLNTDLAALLKQKGLADILSIWDKAQEHSIYELRNMNINAWYSEKGPGSVAFGIQKLQQFHIHIHEDSLDLIAEFEKYRWLKNKDGTYKLNSMGKRIPMKADDHGIDAVRYVMLYYFWQAAEDSHDLAA